MSLFIVLWRRHFYTSFFPLSVPILLLLFHVYTFGFVLALGVLVTSTKRAIRKEVNRKKITKKNTAHIAHLWRNWAAFLLNRLVITEPIKMKYTQLFAIDTQVQWNYLVLVRVMAHSLGISIRMTNSLECANCAYTLYRRAIGKYCKNITHTIECPWERWMYHNECGIPEPPPTPLLWRGFLNVFFLHFLESSKGEGERGRVE